MKSVELTANQLGFAKYLAGLWDKQTAGTFAHGYHITRSRHWRNWRGQVSATTQVWWCESLSEAAARYSWADKEEGLSFEVLSTRLRTRLAASDEEAVRQTCSELFQWGGVARTPNDKSRRWIESQAAAGTLCESLESALRALRPGSADDLHTFNGTTLAMNAAMTKVYAAADPDNVIIYDGRVGAALGLLTRTWLASVLQHTVPTDLAFRWGAKQGDHRARNPSSGSYKFSSLYLPSSPAMHQDRAWATAARKASQIAGAVAVLTDGAATVRDLESALFMIGYDVRAVPLPSPLPTVR